MKQQDLGAGVSVVHVGTQLKVVSPTIDLGWQQPIGRAPGSAVVFDDQPYQVVLTTRTQEGFVWTLEPWDEGETMRTVSTLNAELVAARQREHQEGRSTSRRFWVALPLAPLLALAPAPLQEQWRLRWGFPAAAATFVSALIELVVGLPGVIERFTAIAGGSGFLPPSLGWLSIAGPVLCIEATIRLWHCATQGRPLGSVLGLPLLLWIQPTAPLVAERRPRLRSCDLETGVLELLSPIFRRDWDRDGVLVYRDHSYRLEAVSQDGDTWLYRFTLATEDGEGAVRLRLLPQASSKQKVSREKPPSILKTALVTSVIILAPARFQRRWAASLSIPPLVFTLFGAGAELIGGLLNFAEDHRNDSVFVLLDLFFIAESLIRVAFVVLARRPIGSLLGVPFARLFDHWTREHRLPDEQQMS